MTDDTNIEAGQSAAETKKSKRPLLIGLIMLVAGGGGGFFAVKSGFMDPKDDHEQMSEPMAELPSIGDIAFVPVDPLVINLGRSSHLRFVSQLEVAARYQHDVELLMPRILDVFNGYLRAVGIDEIQDRGALLRIRAHMLRRAQIVTGEGRVRDLLISEFVVN